MDASRFDAIARTLAGGTTRRRLVARAAALGLGGVLVRKGRAAPAAAQSACCIPVPCDCFDYCGGGDCDCPSCCNKCKGTKVTSGVVGGGGVRLAGGGEAYLALAATRVGAPDPEAPAFVGQVQWADGARPLALTSVRLLRYGPLPGEEERGREVVGAARVRGVEGEVPFALRVVVADPAGDGASTVALVAGDPALPALEGLIEPLSAPIGLAYEVEGELVEGGLELVRAEFA